jgi:hypothetical protein
MQSSMLAVPCGVMNQHAMNAGEHHVTSSTRAGSAAAAAALHDHHQHGIAQQILHDAIAGACQPQNLTCIQLLRLRSLLKVAYVCARPCPSTVAFQCLIAAIVTHKSRCGISCNNISVNVSSHRIRIPHLTHHFQC